MVLEAFLQHLATPWIQRVLDDGGEGNAEDESTPGAELPARASTLKRVVAGRAANEKDEENAQEAEASSESSEDGHEEEEDAEAEEDEFDGE